MRLLCVANNHACVRVARRPAVPTMCVCTVDMAAMQVADYHGVFAWEWVKLRADPPNLDK